MHRLIGLCSIALILGCAPANDETNEDAGAETAPLATSLADYAGTWNVQAMPADQDTVVATYVLSATAERDGWTVTFPGRDPMPLRVVGVDGDSVVLEMGPYESALRPGVTVTLVRSVAHLAGGMLTGTFRAVYATEAPDSVFDGRLHGMRGQ